MDMEEVVVTSMQAVEVARAILEARDAEIAFNLQVQETLRNYADFNDDVDDNVLGFGLDHKPPLVVEMQGWLLHVFNCLPLNLSYSKLGRVSGFPHRCHPFFNPPHIT